MKSRESAVLSAITCAILLFTMLVTAAIASPENVFAYEKNQATSQTSTCGNDFFPMNTGCENADSQIQGDENAAALTAQQTFPEANDQVKDRKSIDQKGKLVIETVVSCTIVDTGEQCDPFQFDVEFQIFENSVVSDDISCVYDFPDPNPSCSPHTKHGIPFVTLRPGQYNMVVVIGFDPPPNLESTTSSPDCGGFIESGEIKKCTIGINFETELLM